MFNSKKGFQKGAKLGIENGAKITSLQIPLSISTKNPKISPAITHFVLQNSEQDEEEMKGGTLQINWHDSKPVLTLDFHPLSGLLATGGADFDIKVYIHSPSSLPILILDGN